MKVLILIFQSENFYFLVRPHYSLLVAYRLKISFTLIISREVTVFLLGYKILINNACFLVYIIAFRGNKYFVDLIWTAALKYF